MSRNYQSWLKYKRDTCLRNINKGFKQHEKGEITSEQYSDIFKKYQVPLMDLYNELSSKIHDFPWDSDYLTMLNKINTYSNELEKVDDCLQIFRCSLILYDEYKSKSKKKYTLYELMSGIYGCFGGEEDFIFENVRRDINNNNNNKYSRKDLVNLKIKYGSIYNRNTYGNY